MNRLLQRQLHRCGLGRDAVPADPSAWCALLDRIDETYVAHEKDRYLLERALDVSSREMQSLYDDLRCSSESEIARERDKLWAIINGFRDGFCTLDVTGALVSMNPAAQGLLGARGSMAGEPILYRFTPANGEAVTDRTLAAILARVRAGEELRDRRATLHTYDDERLPVSMLLYPIVQSGEVTGCALMFSDISALVDAETSRRRLAAAVEASADAIYVTSLDGVIEYVNPAFTRITGLSADAAIGRRPSVLADGSTPESVYRDLWRTITAGEVWAGRLLNRRHDGDDATAYWAQTTIAPLRDGGGDPWGFVAVQRDVSADVAREQEQAREMRAAELRARIAGILQGSGALDRRLRAVVAALQDLDGLNLNGAALVVHLQDGDTPAELLRQGETPADLPAALAAHECEGFQPLYLPALEGLLLPIVQAGRVRGGAWLGGRAESALTRAQVSMLSLVAGMIGVAVADDHAKQELDRARSAAMEAVAAKSRFLANMSHEIRTPMNGVLGMLEMLSQTGLDTEQQGFVETALGSAEGLLTVINDVLDFSKIEAGKLDLEHIPFDVRLVAEDVTTLLSARAQSEQLELACYIPIETQTCVVGDPTRLRQVLNNLVGNAVKFTEQGEVVLRILPVTDARSDRAHLHFEVQDTGIGMTPEQSERLFMPFVQADAGTTRRFGGTGLGLAICKQLVELMGGEIGVDSVYGQGSMFWFTVPFERQRAIPAPAADETHLQHLRVLAVDDNATNRAIVAHYLKSWGIACVTAPDGFEALKRLRAAAHAGNPFDIALLDMQMPRLDGLALARRIKSEAEIADIGLMMLSSMGHSDPEIRAEGIRYAIAKPIRQSHLHDALVSIAGPVPVSAVGPGGASPQQSNASEPEPPRPLAARVLLAEDNAVNQRVAMSMLQRLGVQADLAEDGAQAVRMVGERAYDFILMDCQMPNMDGFQATAELRRRTRQDSSAHREPIACPIIIALTANAMAGDRERCIAAGMDDHLAKPLKLAELRACLERWLAVSDAAAPPPAGEPAAQADADAIVVDPDVLSSLQELLEDGFARFLELLAHKTTELMQSLQAGVDAGDAEAVFTAAHALKGSVGNVGAEPAQALAQTLEHKARAGDLAGAPLIMARLWPVHRRLLADIGELPDAAPQGEDAVAAY
ncbi:hypothetical protein CKO31_15020 [Thiohalocapsa halophila]|uniref:histidine kinase n=1 Tax=Thiohalocapsa halophila TaxID=69359 RepID=A0ABS1CJD0_9GAMM|nr:response regulator [Thiohalocapsa halophila]MBK1632025.1 hypothetical protein [Thiohalocapsa halophila]